MKSLTQVIQYEFKDHTLLETALTHKSFHKEHKEVLVDNERLEFLGDSVLSLIISEYLFTAFSKEDEGQLSINRAAIVRKESLAHISKTMGIGQYLKLGKGEEANGGRKRESVLADALEAIIGAIFLDGGFHCAKKFVLAHFDEMIHSAMAEGLNKDYKTLLQEKIQEDPKGKITYKIDKEEGPPHNKCFYISLYINNKLEGQGKGSSKKEGEQNAAKMALEKEIF